MKTKTNKTSKTADLRLYKLYSILTHTSRQIKRYLGMETMVYRMWWEHHSNKIQKELDKEHGTRFANY